MATYKNWLTTNVSDRDSTRAADLQVYLQKIDEWDLSLNFKRASDITAYKIYSLGLDLYVGLSGGLDSEYVAKTFLNCGIPFKTVIVDTPGNQLELSYAYHFCRKYNIEPIILKKTEADMLTCYYRDIMGRLCGYGYNSVATYMVGKYADEMGGIYVMGEHLIDDQDDGSILIGANEWDFYNDALIGVHNTHYFFDYTPEIVYSMVKSIDCNDAQEFKTKLYDLPFRPKLKYQYSQAYEIALKQLRREKWIKHKPNFSFGKPEDFLETMRWMR
jgi:hypothetical protein